MFLKNLQEQKSSPDPENFRWSDQEPFNFFRVFAVFRTLPDGSGTPKVIEQKQKNMIEPEKKNQGDILQFYEFYKRSNKILKIKSYSCNRLFLNSM